MADKRKTVSKKKPANVPAKKTVKATGSRAAGKSASAGTASRKAEAAKANEPAKTEPNSAAKGRAAGGGESKAPAPAAKTAPAKAVAGGVLGKAFLTELGMHIRQAVEGPIRALKGRDIVGTAASGDTTFQIDKVAEKALLAYLRSARQPVAYYSEDSGYTTFTSGQPEALLVVDPIDGTRAAKNGFEGCVVAIAATRTIERPTLGDIESACVVEILGDRVFFAERGKGTKIIAGGSAKKPKVSANTSHEAMAWSMTVPARPAELIFQAAAKLIDISSLKGGFFACNSTSYSLTRLVTNQLDACVDVANRFYRDMPDIVRDQFINAGRGNVLGIAPYDIAASLLVAREAGCVVTDAYGESFDKVLLLDSSVTNQRSLIAAANKELHDVLLKYFNTRIKQLESLLRRRANAAQ